MARTTQRDDDGPLDRLDAAEANRRSMRARIAAHVMHSRHDPRETTAKARQAAWARFEREVDPEGVLPDAERLRRAKCAMRAEHARMAYRSAEARRKQEAKRS